MRSSLIPGVGKPDLVSSAENEALYFCPTTDSFYIYNHNLASVSYTLPDNAMTPLAYETGENQRRQNFSDSGQSWPVAPIHRNHLIQGNHVVFADGHVESMSNKPTFHSFATPTHRPAKSKPTQTAKP